MFLRKSRVINVSQKSRAITDFFLKKSLTINISQKSETLNVLENSKHWMFQRNQEH